MSIQAATIQADVIANVDQAVKTLVDFDAQLQALATSGNTAITITAKTDQAQAQIAHLGESLGQSGNNPVITPKVDAQEAEKSIQDVAEDVKRLLKDNRPDITPEADTSSVRQKLETFFADVRSEIEQTDTELKAFGGSLDKLGHTFDSLQSVASGLSFITTPFLNAASAAEQAYEAHEGLSQSLTSLVAKEELHAGAAKNMTEALALAAPKAEELLKWNQQLAVMSPFSEEGVSQAFRMAQSLGFVSESSDGAVVSAKRLTQATIDWATATHGGEEGMSRVTLALGQIQQKGKLAGDEVMQLVEAGVNVDQILSQAFGKSTAEIQQMREKGLIPANDAILAVVQSLETDYGGAAARSGASMEGLRNSLEDLQKIGLREFFTGTFEAIQPYLQKFVDTANDPTFQKNLRAIGDFLGGDVSAAAKNLNDIATALGAIGTTVGSAVGPLTTLKDGIMSLGESIPIVEKLSHTLGADILQKYSFVGFATAPLEAVKNLGGLVDKLNTYLGITQETDQAETKAVETTKVHTQAHEALANAIALTGEPLKKYQEQLAQLGEQGSEAYGKLNQLASDHTEKMQALEQEHTDKVRQIQADAHDAYYQAEVDHVGRLNEIDNKAADDREKAEGDYYKKIKSLDRAEYKAEQDAAEEHGRTLTAITQKQNDDRIKANDDFGKKLDAIAQKEHDDRLQLEADFQQQLSDIQDKADEQRGDLAESHGDKRAAIEAKIAALTDDTAQSGHQQQLTDEQTSYDARLQALQDANAHTLEIDTREWGERLAAMQQSLQQQEDAENASYDKRYAAWEAKTEAAYQKYEDTIRENQAKLEDLQRDGQERLSDIQEDHTDRLSDLQDKATDKQASLEEKHNDKIAQLKRDQAQATSYQQLERLQQQEVLENEAYQRSSDQLVENTNKELKNEQDAYQKKKERAEREIKEQLDAEKLAADARVEAAKKAYEQEYTAVAQLTDDHTKKLKQIADNGAEALALATREHNEALEALDYTLHQNQEKLLSDHNTKVLAINDAASGPGLEKKRQALEADLAEEDKAYTKSLERLDRSVTDQVTHAQREHDDKSAHLVEALGKDTKAANDAFTERIKNIDDAATASEGKENESYKRRTDKLKETLGENTKAAKDAYDQRLKDIDTAQTTAEGKEKTSYETRLGKLKESLGDKLKAEQKHYEDAEKAANKSYETQQADQKKHLGKLLDDYLKAEETAYPQRTAKIEAQRKKIEQEYGLIDHAGVDAWRDITKATNDALGIVDPRIDTTNDKLEIQRQKLEDQKDAAHHAHDALQHLGEREDDITRKTGDASQATHTWGDLWNSLAGIWNSLMGGGGGGSSGSWSSLPARAEGGPVQQGKMYVVGERGPEILLAGDSGNVLNADQTRDLQDKLNRLMQTEQDLDKQRNQSSASAAKAFEEQRMLLKKQEEEMREQLARFETAHIAAPSQSSFPVSGGVLPPVSSGGGQTVIHQHFTFNINAGALVTQSQLGDFLRLILLDFYRRNPTAAGANGFVR